jgi:membrane AbrB-like protein
MRRRPFDDLSSRGAGVTPRLSSALHGAATLLAAIGGAAAANWLQLPLPWFTGPLLTLAVANMCGARLPSLPHARDGGQLIIGVALGLYFTPLVTREILRLAPWIVVNIAFVLMLGLLGAWLLRRLSGESATTCFFAAPIGGASEMAAQAERHGGRVDRVAAAHSLRIMMVALIVPFALQWLGVHGVDPYAPARADFSLAGLLLLGAVAAAGAVVLARLGVPNQWMLGPLLITAAITAQGITLSALPPAVSSAGQLLIGIALGTRFAPEFFRAAPRYMAAVAFVTLVYLVLSALFGWWLAGMATLPVPTAVVATTPGGIGEMAITAKVLQLGAPVVSAFHSIRMATVVLTVGLVFRLARRSSGGRGRR